MFETRRFVTSSCPAGESIRWPLTVRTWTPAAGSKTKLIPKAVLRAARPGSVFAGWDGVDRGALDLADWRTGRNDLTVPAIARVPEIGALLEELAAQPGASFVRMSGSGATCFALFENLAARDAAARRFKFWHMATTIR